MPENLKRLTDKDWGCGGCLISAVMFITVACIMSITIGSILEHWLRPSAAGAASYITILLTPVNIYICYLLWQIYYRLYGQPPFGYHRDLSIALWLSTTRLQTLFGKTDFLFVFF